MNRLENILMKNEVVLWKGSPDLFAFTFTRTIRYIAAVLIILFFDAITFITIKSSSILSDISSGWLTLPTYITLAFVLCFLVKLLFALFELRNIVYAITDKRIITRTDIFSIDFDNVSYADISNVSLKTSFIETLRGAGTIVVEPASGFVLKLHSIKNPHEVYKLLNEVFADVKSDIEFPNALRPNKNPGYKTTYKRNNNE